MLESYEQAVASFLFETHSVPDQVLHDTATTRDPWRARLAQDVRCTIERTAELLRCLGVTEDQLIQDSPLHPSTARLMAYLDA